MAGSPEQSGEILFWEIDCALSFSVFLPFLLLLLLLLGLFLFIYYLYLLYYCITYFLQSSGNDQMTMHCILMVIKYCGFGGKTTLGNPFPLL